MQVISVGDIEQAGGEVVWSVIFVVVKSVGPYCRSCRSAFSLSTDIDNDILRTPV